MKDINISAALGRKKEQDDSIYRDGDKLIYQTPTYLVAPVSPKIKWSLTIDMKSFYLYHRNNLVQEKDQYIFHSQAYDEDWSINILPNHG